MTTQVRCSDPKSDNTPPCPAPPNVLNVSARSHALVWVLHKHLLLLKFVLPCLMLFFAVLAPRQCRLMPVRVRCALPRHSPLSFHTLLSTSPFRQNGRTFATIMPAPSCYRKPPPTPSLPLVTESIEIALCTHHAKNILVWKIV